MKLKTSIKALAALLFFFAIGVIILMKTWPNPHISPDSIQFPNPVQAVSQARNIIETYRETSDQHGRMMHLSDLPESLRIEGLRAAIVFDDHLSLVLSSNPDWNIGARIWAHDGSRAHEDTPTKYKDIFFYKYCNDYEESPTNIR